MGRQLITRIQSGNCKRARGEERRRPDRSRTPPLLARLVLIAAMFCDLSQPIVCGPTSPVDNRPSTVVRDPSSDTYAVVPKLDEYDKEESRRTRQDPPKRLHSDYAHRDTHPSSVNLGLYTREILATRFHDDYYRIARTQESRERRVDRVEHVEDSMEVEDEEYGEDDEQRRDPKDYDRRDGLEEEELEFVRRSIVEGLGLRKLPDPSKANVSQTEYARAHNEYLKRIESSQLDSAESDRQRRLHIFHRAEHPGNSSIYAARWNKYHQHSLYFPVRIPKEDSIVDHASLRILLDGHPLSVNSVEVVLYLVVRESRKLIFEKKFSIEDAKEPRWIELDSTEAVSWWHENGIENLGLVLEFFHKDSPEWRSFSTAVLNVFTNRVYDPNNFRRRRAVSNQVMSLHKGRRTDCRGDHKKCCRHEMTVIFKDLKGFEFIIQPKTFDAGFCKGRCPPRYNPAHHHALLQSLIWKEDRRKAPRPCCAPSKLDELEILYFDENDSTKLKVSNWKNMKVLECACS